MRPGILFAAALCAFITTGLPSNASAAFRGKTHPVLFHELSGGFPGPGFIPVSVEQARQARAECPVMIRGNIKQYVGRSLYVFEDGSSSILVDIPEDKWPRQDVTPDCLVELRGEVRRSPKSVKIAVAKLVKVQ